VLPGVGLGVQRIVEAFVGPHGGHGDDAVVGLAIAAKPLPADMRGAGAVFAVAGVVDSDHAAGVWCGRRVVHQKF
jgi:hypothetical protein